MNVRRASSNTRTLQVLAYNGAARTNAGSNEGGVKHLKAFFREESLREEIEHEVCKETVIEGFGLFLFNVVRNENSATEKFLAPATTGEYFGHGKEYTRRLHPNNPIWINHDTPKGEGRNNDGGWFTRMKTKLVDACSLRSIENGISIENKANPLG